MRFHFCLYKLNWYLTAGCARRERWACHFSMALDEDDNSVRNQVSLPERLRFSPCFYPEHIIPAVLPCRGLLFMEIVAKD